MRLLAGFALALTLCGALTATPVRTIQSPDGDIIDCINKLNQPAFNNPLLKNHLFQETPTDMVDTEDGLDWQVWHTNGGTCPRGTIPIRRFEANITHVKYHPMSPNAATNGHQYAIGFVKLQPIYGTVATLNVWDPIVESGDDFSLAQIWVASGKYETNDLNTIEAGWQVYPNRYGDRQPRLFNLWTRDAYLNTGCYGVHCEGFVHVSRNIALEAAISRASTIGGDQFSITIQMWKDRVTGNWWMGMGKNVVPVGYWPAEIFTTLSDHAEMAQWGGEVFYRNTSGLSTIAQMGSGQYADKGFGEAAYICNLQIASESRTFQPIQEFAVRATQPKSYTIKKTRSRECGAHFYYGGPGPLHSASSVRVSDFSFMFLLFSSCHFFFCCLVFV